MDKIIQKVLSYAKNAVFMDAAPIGKYPLPLHANNERYAYLVLLNILYNNV